MLKLPDLYAFAIGDAQPRFLKSWFDNFQQYLVASVLFWLGLRLARIDNTFAHTAGLLILLISTIGCILNVLFSVQLIVSALPKKIEIKNHKLLSRGIEALVIISIIFILWAVAMSIYLTASAPSESPCRCSNNCNASHSSLMQSKP